MIELILEKLLLCRHLHEQKIPVLLRDMLENPQSVDLVIKLKTLGNLISYISNTDIELMLVSGGRCHFYFCLLIWNHC